MTVLSQRKFWPLLATFTLFSVFFFFSTPVHAADPKPTIKDSAYGLKYVSQSIADPIKIEAGKMQTVVFKFKNTGTETLKATGPRYVSAYTVEPRYHDSLFEAFNWKASDETAALSKNCAPGKICELSLQLQAPKKAGTYKEEFYLAAKNYTWIQGGYFWVDIRVTEPAAATPPAPAPQAEAPAATPAPAQTVLAKIIGQSKKRVEVKGGEKITFSFVLKNAGTKEWAGYQLQANSPTALAASNRLTFADEKWKSDTYIRSTKKVIPPGTFERVNIAVRAPITKGEYVFTLQSVVDGAVVEGSTLNLEVEVTSDAPDHYTPPVFKNAPMIDAHATSSAPETKPRLGHEPRIKVGLWNIDQNYVVIRPVDDDYNVYTGGTFHGVLAQGKSATLKLRGDVYSLKAGELNVKSPDYIRLEPKNNPHAVFQIVNLERTYQKKIYNQYRGAAEYRRVTDGEEIYLINDLLMSDYVAGIGENSNAAPAEYLKAQSVAQRTYAYYIKEYSDKHDKRNFDVVAHTGDQLYLGYQSESERNNFVSAAKATDGYMVTYDLDNNPATESNVVITPYFAYTNGRTKSWEEVWGGHKPWLVAVPAVYDKIARRKLFGHGVGMSQLDASERAEKLGEDWKTLLKYYYTGTEVEKIY